MNGRELSLFKLICVTPKAPKNQDARACDVWYHAWMAKPSLKRITWPTRTNITFSGRTKPIKQQNNFRKKHIKWVFFLCLLNRRIEFLIFSGYEMTQFRRPDNNTMTRNLFIFRLQKAMRRKIMTVPCLLLSNAWPQLNSFPKAPSTSSPMNGCLIGNAGIRLPPTHMHFMHTFDDAAN